MYVSMTRFCRTLVPEIHLRLEMLRLFLYIDVVHMCNCQFKTPEQRKDHVCDL